MVFLTARFAFIACLCVAIPVVLPIAEAAHIYGSHSTVKHLSSPYSHRGTRTGGHSSFGRPTATHRHGGNSNGHQALDHQALGLPPLLQRDRVHGHDKAHDQYGQGPHDGASNRGLRSAFARSRYRHEPAYLSRRSSVYLPGERGDTYLVSWTEPRNVGLWHTGRDAQLSHSDNRRQVDESNLVLGRVDIISTAQSANSTQRMGSLWCEATDTSDLDSDKVFALSASTTNQTQFIMMPADEALDSAGSSSKYVNLAVEAFDPNQAGMVMYCATYDPDFGATSVLLMTPCTGATQSAASADNTADPCADDENTTSSTNSHESQIFSYDPSSGKIEPVASAASSSGTSSGSGNMVSCARARVRRDNSTATTSGSARPSSTSTSTAPAASVSQQAQSVMLVFSADALEVPVSSPPIATSTGQVPVLTRTVTTTVEVVATTSGSSTSAGTPAQAAASVPTSSISSQSTPTSAPSGLTTATATRSSLSVLSSVPTTATMSAPVNADESLEIEVVGIVPSTTATFSPSPSLASTTITTTTTTTSSATTSVNPLALASSVANAMASQAPVYVSGRFQVLRK